MSTLLWELEKDCKLSWHQLIVRGVSAIVKLRGWNSLKKSNNKKNKDFKKSEIIKLFIRIKNKNSIYKGMIPIIKILDHFPLNNQNI